MKRTVLLFAFLTLLSFNDHAQTLIDDADGLMPISKTQNLLALPESIIYDSLHSRYLISNYLTGDIIQVDSNGDQSYFAQGVHAIQGLEIVGNVVYAGCDSLIRGFDLETGSMVMDVHVPGVNNLNDVTADNAGNLYSGDVFGTKIIKVNISTQNWWVFVDGNGINRPNGIYFDEPFNRILVCSFRPNSPIQAINLPDSSVSTLTATDLTNCDGLTKDKYGRYYVTSWQTKSIYRFDNAFSNPPQVVYTNSCGPADISYDRVHDALAIPLQSCNSWDTSPVDPSVGMMEDPNSKSYGSLNFDVCYPNPTSGIAIIKYTINEKDKIRLSVCGINMSEHLTIFNEVINPGIYSREVNLENLKSGIYLFCLQAGSQSITKKIVITN